MSYPYQDRYRVSSELIAAGLSVRQQLDRVALLPPAPVQGEGGADSLTDSPLTVGLSARKVSRVMRF